MHLEIITRRPAGQPRPAPLLFVHGAWHGAWCWDEHFLPYFADHGYEAHALSLRGHGKSAGNVRWASALNYVTDVEQVARSLPRPPVVIGHSMGGYVVQKYLEQNRAPAAVLLAPIPSFGILPFLLRLLRHDPLALLKSLLQLNPYPIIGSPERVRRYFFSDLPPAAIQTYFERMQSESFRMVLDASLLNLPRPVRVTAPMLVMGAANDAVFPQREVITTAQTYGARAEIFPDMAHDMMLEPGWQSVADRILAWLAERDL